MVVIVIFIIALNMVRVNCALDRVGLSYGMGIGIRAKIQFGGKPSFA